MSGINKAASVHLQWAKNDEIHLSLQSTRFVASVFQSNRSVIELHTTDGVHVKSLPMPGCSLDDYSCTVTCCWSPEETLLAGVSSVGHVVIWTIGQSGVDRESNVKLPFTFRKNRSFHACAFSRDGETLFVVSGFDVIRFKKVNGEFQLFKSVPYASGSPDFPISIDVHPTGFAVAICSSARKSVLIVAAGSSGQDVLKVLRKKPAEDEPSGNPPQSEDSDTFLPSVLNELGIAGSERKWPVACAWSKYGESLAYATGDNLLSVWNPAGRSIETVSVGEESVVIRSVAFLNDVLVVATINDSNRILIVNIDEGILYDSDETAVRGSGISSKCTSVSLSLRPDGILISRPGDGLVLSQWRLAV